MTTKREQRAAEVASLRADVRAHCAAIPALFDRLPEDANLGTQRAIRNAVSRALVEVRDYIERENARREARNG